MDIQQIRESKAARSGRLGVFYLSVVAFVAVLVLFVGELLLLPFTAWFDPAVAGVHFIHDVTFMGMLLVTGVAVLVQLYRPAERVVAMQLAVLVGLLTLVTSAVTGFDPMLVVFLGPVAVAALLHPARARLIRFDALAEGTENRLLLALAAVALVPVGLYAVGELTLQATLADEHAEFGHYAGMATYALTFVLLAALAAVSGAGHRVAAYVAGLMAVLLAAASLFLPVVSAIETTWSALAVLWAVAVVAVYEWGVRPAASPGVEAGADEGPDEDLGDALDQDPVAR